MGVVRLKNMVFYGYHGVAEPEKILGGKIEVDAELQFDMSKAIQSDHLNDTINYETVYKLIHDVVTNYKFFLIEALAGKIIGTIFKTYQVDAITVRVRKPNAPIKGVLDTVEVEVMRNRQEMSRMG